MSSLFACLLLHDICCHCLPLINVFPSTSYRSQTVPICTTALITNMVVGWATSLTVTGHQFVNQRAYGIPERS
ncbi:hypothetical protein F4604DRAFT_1761278 [Suillus subluteus]|nr:hypothetical protein F4604DRAFT_1761278 [Suillus subluteus]